MVIQIGRTHLPFFWTDKNNIVRNMNSTISELRKVIPKKKSLRKLDCIYEIPLTIPESKYKLANTIKARNIPISTTLLFFMKIRNLNSLNKFLLNLNYLN
jgi:hypothetical protein